MLTAPALAAIACLALNPVPAAAKGSTMRFDRVSYEPGDRVIGRAWVRTWPAREPSHIPYGVYLVEGTQPLWYHHLPRRAVRVGTLEYAQKGKERYIARVEFVLPEVDEGTHAVWVCSVKDCRTGFGDLVDAFVQVGRPAGSLGPAVAQEPRSLASDKAEPVESSLAWPLVAVSAVLVLGFMAVGLIRRGASS